MNYALKVYERRAEGFKVVPHLALRSIPS